MYSVCATIVNEKVALQTRFFPLSSRELRDAARTEAVHLPAKVRTKEAIRQKMIADLCYLTYQFYQQPVAMLGATPEGINSAQIWQGSIIGFEHLFFES